MPRTVVPIDRELDLEPDSGAGSDLEAEAPCVCLGEAARHAETQTRAADPAVSGEGPEQSTLAWSSRMQSVTSRGVRRLLNPEQPGRTVDRRQLAPGTS